MGFGPPMHIKLKGGEDLILKPPTEEQLDQMFAGSASYQAWQTLLSRSVFMKPDIEDFLEHVRTDKDGWLWGMFLDDGETIVGTTSVKISRPGIGNSGILIYKDHWGKGVASAAHRLRTYFAFNEIPNLLAIESEVEMDNPGSYKALQGVGYVITGNRYHLQFRDGQAKHAYYLTCVNPKKVKWDAFWDGFEPPEEFMAARQVTQSVIDSIDRDAVFL